MTLLARLGKSSLLMTILGELSLLRGQLEAAGTMAYSSQHPWIISESVRDNILFGLPEDPVWYQQVIDACQLTQDLEEFEDGDETVG